MAQQGLRGGVTSIGLPNAGTVRTTGKPKLLTAEPQLFVADIGTSCDFYTRKLGFKVAFTYGEPAFYGQVYRDGARLNLRRLALPAIDPTLRAREDLLSASIPLDDADALYAEFQSTGVVFHQEIKSESWGARTFVITDPDGNLILFAGRE